MTPLAQHFMYIVFHDYWNMDFHHGSNHNAADRCACFEVLLAKCQEQEHFQEMETFWNEHSEGGNSKIAEQACWTVGRFAPFIDTLYKFNGDIQLFRDSVEKS